MKQVSKKQKKKQVSKKQLFLNNARILFEETKQHAHRSFNYFCYFWFLYNHCPTSNVARMEFTTVGNICSGPAMASSLQ